MAENISIPKISADQETDYTELRNEGITLLQRLAGDVWTDYNEHDPGVTILEELCYLLTELYERTEIPIANILTQKNGILPAKENALFSAADIFHNNPLTPNDYRKVIIDQVSEVNNAWVIPFYLGQGASQTLGISGIYNVIIDLQEGISKTDQIKIRKIENEIKQVLNAKRNVGEMFSEISFLDQSQLTISCSIYMAGYVDGEATLANILFAIENYLKPGITFYNYDEMVEMGIATEDIFEGPKLDHGFIVDSTLTNRVSVIYVDSILKMISQVQGVNGVIGLHLYDAEGNDKPGKYVVPVNQAVFLQVIKSLENIKIYKQNVLYPYNSNLVISNYNELKSNSKRPGKFKLLANKLNIEIPQGVYSDPARYFSLQNDFPVIYGIGKTSRLSKNTADTRKAQALQLKTYLLYYEQVLADFMEQLANTNKLFSVEKQDRSFFYQPIYSVPDVSPLLKGFSGSPAEIYDTTKGDVYATDCKTFKQNQNEYITGLENIYRETDDFAIRRNSFLDHLLARFNYTLLAFSTSYTNPLIKNFTFDSITVKEHLLKNMCEITASRGSMASYTSKENGESITHTSGLEKNLRIMSGIRHNELKNIQVNNYNILSASVSDQKKILLNLDKEGQVHINIRHENFHELLEAGMFLENYRIEQHDHESVISLEINNEMHKVYAIPHEHSGTPQEIIKELVNDFLKMYLQYENFFVIEHILLKPATNEKVFTWIDQSSNKIPSPAPAEYTMLETSLDDAFVLYNKDKVHNVKPDPLIVVDKNDYYVSQYFYSARVSFILPESSATIKGKPFQDYFNYLVVSNFPAHIRVEIFWLKNEEYGQFIKLYENYVENTDLAKEQMTDYLLKQLVYEGMKIKK